VSEVALYEPPVEANARRRWVELMKPAAELANAITGTEFVPARIRNNPGAIAACVLYGDEVGLGPMQSLAKISVIEGTPSLAAEAMRALILARGHELWFEEQTVSRVTIVGKRKGEQQQTKVTWTLDDARRANLAGRQNWRTYPRHMLAARATSELAGLIFADVIGGLRATEELEEDEASSAPAGGPPPERRGDGQRRRRDRTTGVAPTAAPRPAPTEPEEAGLPPLPGEPSYDPTSDEPDEAQKRALHAEFRRRGLDREQRLAWVGHFLGRQIGSFNELSAREHSKLLRRLAEEPVTADLSADEPQVAEGPDPEPEAADEPTEQAREGTEPTALRLDMFMARVAGEQFDRDQVIAVRDELYPGRESVRQLNDQERARLMETLLERRGEAEL
jgi:hypothetical protein